MSAPRILLMCEFEKDELAGGESVLFGFVEGLVAQAENQIQIIVLTSRSMQAALHELLPPPNKVVARPELLISPATRLKRKLRKIMPGVVAVIRKALRMNDQGMPKEVAGIDDFSLGLAPDIIHWFYPLHYAISDIPDICTVHDLNYEHLSDGFEEEYVTWRRKLMNEQVTQSQALVAISRFVADDVAARYPEAHEKIRTVKWAPFIRPENQVGTSSFAQAPALGDFILYPAATYRHKNHVRLVQALRIVNGRRTIPLRLVLTGPLTTDWRDMEQRFASEIAEETLLHLGFVAKCELTRLYHACRLVAFPSLFEGAGLPLMEAIAMGRTIICSDIPVFREYGGDFPLYFNPMRAESIADAIERGMEQFASRQTPVALRTWSNVADDYIGIYQDILSATGRAGDDF